MCCSVVINKNFLSSLPGIKLWVLFNYYCLLCLSKVFSKIPLFSSTDITHRIWSLMERNTSVAHLYNLISPQKSPNIHSTLSCLLPVELNKQSILGSVPWGALRNSKHNKQGKVYFHWVCFLSHDYSYRVPLFTLKKYDLFVLQHIHQGIISFQTTVRKNKELAWDIYQ